jgi:hypothetical protein
MIFLGTPHRGSSFTSLGRLAAQALRPLGSNSSLLAEVEYDSSFLLDLQRTFENALPMSICVVNFFELRRTRIARFWFLVWEEFVRYLRVTHHHTLTRDAVCYGAISDL